MYNSKMRAFFVMVLMLIVTTIISISVAGNEKKVSAYIVSVNDDDIFKKIMNTDETSLISGIREMSSICVMDEVENIMTYDDALAFKTVNLKKGQTVICSYGSSELILLSGGARVYSKGNFGLINVSDGLEYRKDMAINRQQLYIMPEPEKSGAVVTSEEASFLIRGGYEIKE